MGVHDSCRILFECQTKTFVEVFTDCFVVWSGGRYDGVGVTVMDPIPFGEGNDCDDIIIPFDDIVCCFIRKFWEVSRRWSFNLPSSDLFVEGVLGNVCAVGGFGLERGYRSCECRDEGRILVKDAILLGKESLDAGV